MKIYQLLNKNTVRANVHAETKLELIDFIVDLFKTSISSEQLAQIRTAVKEREMIMSTGVGKGLAIPHAKVSGLTQNFAAFVLLDKAIEYESIDNIPVNMVFLIVGPSSQNSEHIKMLSRISRLMNNDDFRTRLANCKSQEAIISIFESEENQFFNT